MKKHWVPMVLVLLLSGCLSRKNLVGEYYMVSERTLAKHALELKNDSTFNYFVTGDLVDNRCSGRWSFDGRETIVLHSDGTKRFFLTEFNEYRDSLVKGLEIKVVDRLDGRLSYAGIGVNGDREAGIHLNENGKGMIEVDQVDSVTIGYLGMTITHRLKDPEANSLFFKVRINEASCYSLTEKENRKVGLHKLTVEDGRVLRKQARVQADGQPGGPGLK